MSKYNEEDGLKRRTFPYPIRPDEMFNRPKQLEALFPKEILEPLYKQFIEEQHKAGILTIAARAEDFYRFLLVQSKTNG